MRGVVVGAMGMQKVVAGGLLGVHGVADATLGSSSSGAESRRIMTPQQEYPIFEPGFREAAAAAQADSQSWTSFQDSDGQGIWKEIHTDTQGTAGQSSHSILLEMGHQLLTPSVSDTSLHNGPYADYVEPPPQPARNYDISKVLHSPQNVNILSPQLRPLEKSPKRTQLHIASPRLTANGGLTPMVNQLTVSSEVQQSTRPDFDLPSTMLPPASNSRSPHQVALSGSMGSSMKLKKMMKATSPRPQAAAAAAAADADQSPRSSAAKDRSPSRSWKKSFRATASPALQSGRDKNQPIRGMAREMNGSFQRAKARASAAAAVTSWRAGVGDAPVILTSQEFSGEIIPQHAADAVNRMGGKKVQSTQKSGSYNIFNLLSWVRKKSGSGCNATLKKESFLDSDDLGSVKADSESIKVLDDTIKTLRYKLEKANQNRAAAVQEVRALQAAVEVSDERCRQLVQRCQELDLKLSARYSSGVWDMLEPEDQSGATYIVGLREPTLPSTQRFSSQELTSEQFLKVFEESIASLRKLASAICIQIREMGESATQVVTALLEQHKVGRAISRMPRNVIILYFESFLNQVMFESFENISFEPNGASPVFDPDMLKQTCYQSYQDLKNQDWPTIEKSLGKTGALVVNASFHRFFVVRMELILSQLGKLAENEISANLMAAFFNSVKAVWLVHHMAFAFDQPVSIFRVSPASEFDARFMEQGTASDHDLESTARSKVSIMLNPGFIVNRQIIKCQVYCSSKYQ